MPRSFSLLLITVLAVWGCSESAPAPLAPDSSPAASVSLSADLSGVVEFLTLPSLSGVRRAERFISAAQGGSVELNGFRLDIPPGALPHDAVISIQLPTDAAGAKRVIAEFGPHGIQFNTPVTITFPLVGVILPTGGVEVSRWQNGGWTPLGGTVAPDGASISSTTPHFSEYAVTRKEMAAGG